MRPRLCEIRGARIRNPAPHKSKGTKYRDTERKAEIVFMVFWDIVLVFRVLGTLNPAETPQDLRNGPFQSPKQQGARVIWGPEENGNKF